jgi:phage major head subunit gpT-like protein
MPLVTPEFVVDFESNMRVLTENEYARFQDPANTWWDLIARVKPSMTKRELVAWFLSTAQIYDQGEGGGTFRFQDPLMIETEFTPRTAGAGLRIKRQQFEDIDGNGIDGGEGLQAGALWSRDMGAQFGYWPQLKVAELLKNGEIGTGYDGLPFFHTGHYLNGTDSGAGTYSNLLVGAGYRIDSGVTLDQAAINLAAVYKAIRSIKMPNGKQQRMLRPAGILCGPAMFPRVSQLLDAKFLAIAAAGGGAGSGDFTGYVSRMGYGKVTEAPELVESEYDTSYYVVVEQLGSSELGALVYLQREAFSVRYYTGRGGGIGIDAILDRLDVLEWHASGRNGVGYGHPYLLLKVKAA